MIKSRQNESFLPKHKSIPANDHISIAKAIISCAFYMIIGPTLILNNNHILRSLDFKFPMFISLLGLIFTSFTARTLVYTKVSSLNPQNSQNITPNFYLTNFLPVGVSLALTLTFGNAVYLYLGVALIQMLKAFTPVIVMLGLFFSGLEKPRKEVVLSVVGTVLNCAGSKEFNFTGIICMFLAEFFEALRLVLTQFLLKNKKFSVIEGQFYLAPVSGFCLFILWLFSESQEMMKAENLGIIMENKYYFVLSGCLGILVNLSSFFVVQTTSSVTLKILGTVRNAGLVLLQVMVGKETITFEQFIAYGITIVAFGFYNYYKLKN
eukprot:snap_masked-scaffold_2-processed-gene-9.26-mRNA-1 protein AED:0.04 eAED:0.04 QI:0/0/0/1/1/1/2/0/321